MDVNFRKIDVDQYDEDVLLDNEIQEPDPRDPSTVLSETKQKSTTIRGYLSKYSLHLFVLNNGANCATCCEKRRYSWCFRLGAD
jgi:hypothetical protein